VTTKERHVLTFWFDAVSTCINVLNREVSAGEVARHVGQTTPTAKRYLKRLVGEGAITSSKVMFKNGTEGMVYGHID